MSSGKLKAATNRVRTSIALQANSMWTNTIGQQADPQAGSNAAIEAAINAPQFGSGRVARRAAAAEAVKQTGGFNSAVDNYESLLSLARSQGAVGGANRGACKKCGQLGHLTKQCRNDQSAFFAQGDEDANHAKPAGVSVERPPVPPAADDDLSSLSSDNSDSPSNSNSDSSSSEERRGRKRKRKHKEQGVKDHKHKAEKERKHKKHKGHKHKHKHKRHKASRH